MLEMSPAYAPVQRRLLKETGVMDLSAETILEMRSILSEYKDYLSKQPKK